LSTRPSPCWPHSTGITRSGVVEAVDRQGLLRDISDVLAKQKVNVIGVNTQSTKGIGDRRAFMTFTVEIDNAERLGIVLGLVAKVTGVDSARRR
jgi:GTP pyrophosphokinase